MSRPELEYAVLDPQEDSEAGQARVNGFLDAVFRGFHDARPAEETRKHYRTHLRTDRAKLRGAWLPAGAFGASEAPVATFTSFDKNLNAGAGLVPLRMITDVTVSAAHRRRGLLRRLMTEDLDDAKAAGLPLAALTVSEATIYGRFGFGLATWRSEIEVDTSAKFGLRADVPTAPGRVEIAEPGELAEIQAEVFDRVHTGQRGSVARPHFYRPMLTGFDFDEGSPDRKLRAAVHVDADERPDGYVVYKHLGYEKEPYTIKVVDLVAEREDVRLSLWEFLGSIDLAERVAWNNAPVDDPLPWAMLDSSGYRVRQVEDHIWVRVLDVPAALAGRPWYGDGSVVLEVDDPMRYAAGRWALTVKDGSAEAVATEAGADVRLSVEALGSLYLGGVTVPTLAATGRLQGSPEALRTLAGVMDGGPAPYSLTSF